MQATTLIITLDKTKLYELLVENRADAGVATSIYSGEERVSYLKQAKFPVLDKSSGLPGAVYEPSNQPYEPSEPPAPTPSPKDNIRPFDGNYLYPNFVFSCETEEFGSYHFSEFKPFVSGWNAGSGGEGYSVVYFKAGDTHVFTSGINGDATLAPGAKRTLRYKHADLTAECKSNGNKLVPDNDPYVLIEKSSIDNATREIMETKIKDADFIAKYNSGRIVIPGDGTGDGVLRQSFYIWKRIELEKNPKLADEYLIHGLKDSLSIRPFWRASNYPEVKFLDNATVIKRTADTPVRKAESDTTPANPGNEPGQPSQPGGTDQPSQPGQQPSQPGGSDQPSQPVQPSQPDGTGNADQPSQPGGTGNTDQPGQPSQPGGTGNTEQPGQPGQPNQPGGTDQPGQPGQPGGTGNTGQPSQPGGTDQPSQPGQQPSQPGQQTPDQPKGIDTGSSTDPKDEQKAKQVPVGADSVKQQLAKTGGDSTPLFAGAVALGTLGAAALAAGVARKQLRQRRAS